MKAGWVRVGRHWRLVGWIAVWLAIAFALNVGHDGRATADRLQRQRVHDNTVLIGRLRDDVAHERHDVAVLCASSRANRQVIHDLLAVGGGNQTLASVATAKLADRQLAAIIDLLVTEQRAAHAAADEIIGRAIPCASPTSP